MKQKFRTVTIHCLKIFHQKLTVVSTYILIEYIYNTIQYFIYRLYFF